MSCEVARRVTPVTGSTKSGAELAVAMTGSWRGKVTSYFGSRPRSVIVGGTMARYFSTTGAGIFTSSVEWSTCAPNSAKRCRAFSLRTISPASSSTSSEASWT